MVGGPLALGLRPPFAVRKRKDVGIDPGLAPEQLLLGQLHLVGFDRDRRPPPSTHPPSSRLALLLTMRIRTNGPTGDVGIVSWQK